MSSLADRIAEKNELEREAGTAAVDELGIPIPTPETPAYWAAKMIGLDYRAKLGEPSIRQLHTREGALYDGHKPVAETLGNFYKYTRIQHPIKKWELVEFWRQVKDHVPKLNRRFLEVDGGMYWDLEGAELVDFEEVKRRLKGKEKR